MAMIDNSASSNAQRIGMPGPFLCALGTLTSGSAIVLVFVLVHPQPPWNRLELFVESVHRIKTLSY